MIEEFAFVKGALLQFKNTGSFFATSAEASRAMISSIDFTKPQRILEVGPGTGSITKHLVKNLNKESHLSICEINPFFMDYVKAEITKWPNYSSDLNIDFFLGPIQDMPCREQTEKFDHIVCALPFLNFPLELTKDIFSKLDSMSHEATLLTFYQYIGFKHLKKFIGSKDSREEFITANTYLNEVISKRLVKQEQVWWNMFPITIFTLKQL